jgi:hypothetical protein
MWADRYLRNTLQLKFRNSVELAHVLAETLKISVNTTVIPRVTSVIRSSKTARKAKTRKTKMNFPLLSEKRRWERRSVCERKELAKRKLARKLKSSY